MTQLGAVWDEPELLAEAEGFAELLPPLIAKDELLDIIGGSAGCIGGLLSLYRCRPSDRTLAAAVQCGDWLVDKAQLQPMGVAWVTKIPASRPLAGFSHGTAGMAWALLHLAAVTGQQRFRETALAALAYERSVFSPEAGNWPDLRKLEKRGQAEDGGLPKFMCAWCHGAPGIGLARLTTLPLLDDATTRAEIEAALRTTLPHGFGGNHSLCHGDLGNLELLLQAARVLSDPQWKAHARRLGSVILESIREHGWLCGVPLCVETPGLMTGLAGIGYGLLRLACPERVPSVLTLEPPRLAADAFSADANVKIVSPGDTESDAHDAALSDIVDEWARSD